MASWRVIFFAINFGLSLFLVVACLTALGTEWVRGGSPVRW
jgi:hypothetical protein